jgi:hypothetical protein
MNIQSDWKVMQTIPDTCSICQKINYIEIKKKQKKRCYIKCWKCPLHSVMHAITVFLMSDATRWRVSACFLYHRNGSPDEILSIFLAQENQEMYPKTQSGKLSKNEMPSSVQQWTLVAFVKKTSLHIDCLKTTDGLARAGYNMTWPAWALV